MERHKLRRYGGREIIFGESVAEIEAHEIRKSGGVIDGDRAHIPESLNKATKRANKRQRRGAESKVIAIFTGGCRGPRTRVRDILPARGLKQRALENVGEEILRFAYRRIANDRKANMAVRRIKRRDGVRK